MYKDLHSNIISGRIETAVGIPYIHWSGTLELWNKVPYHILVMEKLGPDLHELFELNKRHFSTKTVLMLARQILNRIEFLHKKNYIHRDIKPGNFLMGLGETKDIVYLADFGLTLRNDGKYREDSMATGTIDYMSINTHKGISQSRRDDLESLGYVLMLFQTGTLPWYNTIQRNCL